MSQVTGSPFSAATLLRSGEPPSMACSPGLAAVLGASAAWRDASAAQAAAPSIVATMASRPLAVRLLFMSPPLDVRPSTFRLEHPDERRAHGAPYRQGAGRQAG